MEALRGDLRIPDPGSRPPCSSNGRLDGVACMALAPSC